MNRFTHALRSVLFVFFALLFLLVITQPARTYPPFLAKAKALGFPAQDCTYCHVNPTGGDPLGPRAEWLVKEKEKRSADRIDIAWLKDYPDDAKGSASSSTTSSASSDNSAPKTDSKKDPKRMEDAARHSQDAAKVFKEIMGAPDKGIPKELLDKAQAIAVFPGMVKAGFVVGGRGGQGVISRRIPGGWSAPAFFNVGGGSFGAQIGVEKTDAVLLFMNDDALKSLLQDKFEIGGELSVAAGPVGRTASASTDAMLKAGILSYSRSKGLFAGALLKGAVVNPDNDLNEAIYGMKANDLLTGSQKMSKADTPAVVSVFPQTLSTYSKK